MSWQLGKGADMNGNQKIQRPVAALPPPGYEILNVLSLCLFPQPKTTENKTPPGLVGH